jgi:hypothetical protein
VLISMTCTNPDCMHLRRILPLEFWCKYLDADLQRDYVEGDFSCPYRDVVSPEYVLKRIIADIEDYSIYTFDAGTPRDEALRILKEMLAGIS